MPAKTERKVIEVQSARTAEPGVDFTEDWDVAEADKDEHRLSKLAGSRIFDVPNEVHDSRPLTVAVDPSFKGTVVRTETGFMVLEG